MYVFVWTSKQKQAKPPKPQGSHLSTSLSNTMLDSMKSVLISWNQPWWEYMLILWKAENIWNQGIVLQKPCCLTFTRLSLSKNQTQEFQGLEELVLGKNNIIKRFCSKKKPKKKKSRGGGGQKLEGNVWCLRQLCLVVRELSGMFLFCLWKRRNRSHS